jgi:hypothetical protein
VAQSENNGANAVERSGLSQENRSPFSFTDATVAFQRRPGTYAAMLYEKRIPVALGPLRLGVSEVAWARTDDFLELTREVVAVIEAALEGDLGNGQIGAAEEPLRGADTDPDEMLHGCASKHTLEGSDQ